MLLAPLKHLLTTEMGDRCFRRCQFAELRAPIGLTTRTTQ
jgi:hypothetical protein